jgi:hypothetical protein
MSAAPEIARLAEAVLFVPAQPAVTPNTSNTQNTPKTQKSFKTPEAPEDPETAAPQLTLGTLARLLRMVAATPERWWGLVRFDPDRSVKIRVEEHPSYQAWLVVLRPGDTGQACDCDVATIIAGEATDGTPSSQVLRPGPLRVHGQPHWLRGQGAGYSISLHARAHRPAMQKQ